MSLPLPHTPAPPLRGAAAPFVILLAALAAACALLLGSSTAEAALPRELWAASVDRQVLKLHFNELLNPGSVPASSAFEVTATPPGGTPRTISGTGTVTVSSHVTATVTLASAVSEGEKLTVSYTKPATNPLQYYDGAAVRSFSHTSEERNSYGDRRVTNDTDATKPNLAFAKLNGATLTLYYDELLKEDAVPTRGAFRIAHGGFASAPATDPSVFRNTVTLLVVSAAAPNMRHGLEFRLSYTPRPTRRTGSRTRRGTRRTPLRNGGTSTT